MTRIFANTVGGSAEGALRRPLGIVDSVIERQVIKSKYSGPFLEASSLSSKGYIDVVSLVLSLLKACGPSAILRFVISGLVRITVNGMTLCWWFSHILKEFFKRISPAMANYGAFSAIVFVALNFFVGASLDKPSPSNVSLSVCLSVCSGSYVPIVNFQTTATSFMTRFHSCAACPNTVSTIAYAPKNCPVFAFVPKLNQARRRIADDKSDESRSWRNNHLF